MCLPPIPLLPDRFPSKTKDSELAPDTSQSQEQLTSDLLIFLEMQNKPLRVCVSSSSFSQLSLLNPLFHGKK